MFKRTYILALLLAGATAAPTYAQHANPSNEPENTEADGQDTNGSSLAQPEPNEAEKLKKAVDALIAQHAKDLEKAEKEKMSDTQKASLEAALAALMDPNGSLEGLDEAALKDALKLLQDKLAKAPDGEEKTKIQGAIDRGTKQLEARTQKKVEQLAKLAQGYGAAAWNALNTFTADPKKAVGDAAFEAGKLMAGGIQEVAKAQVDAEKSEPGSLARWTGAAVGAVGGYALGGIGGAVAGAAAGYAMGSAIDRQAQQTGGYTNYASNLLGGTNYTAPKSEAIPNAPVTNTVQTASPSPQIVGGAIGSPFATSPSVAPASGATSTPSTSRFFDNSQIESDLGKAVSQAGNRGSSGATSRPTDYGDSNGTTASTPATNNVSAEPGLQEKIADVMKAMPRSGSATETAEPEVPTTQSKLTQSAIQPPVTLAASATTIGGAAKAAAVAEATATGLAAAKLPEAVARNTASAGAKVDEDKAVAPITRTAGIYAEVKKAPEKPVVLESYATPSIPPGSTSVETETETVAKESQSPAKIPESSIETASKYMKSAVESLIKSDSVRGIASVAATTVVPLPVKLTIAGLTNPKVSEATVKALQEALPKSLIATLPVAASKMDRSLLGLLQKNNGEIAQRGIAAVKSGAALVPRKEPSPNAVVNDSPKGDIFTKFFAGQI